jgi:hypothetical protein
MATIITPATEYKCPETLASAKLQTTIYCKLFISLTPEKIEQSIKFVSPSAKFSTWPVEGAENSEAKEYFGIKLDGWDFLVFNTDKQVKESAFDDSFYNYIMPHPKQIYPLHHSAISVHKTITPETIAEAVQVARGVTIITKAINRLAPALAVKWHDANHIVPSTRLDLATPGLGVDTVVAPVFWVRILPFITLAGTPREERFVAGSIGLEAFGMREFEFLPSRLSSDDLLIEGNTISIYIFSIKGNIVNGDLITTRPGRTYKITSAESGKFSPRPVFLFDLLENAA